MKTKQLVTHLAAAAFCCVLGSSALSAATTTPVGAVSVTVPSGNSLLSFPMQKAKLWQGDVSNVSGTTFEISSPPSSANPLYVQVTSGLAEGSIATILSINSNVVTLENSISDLADGDTVAIREHTILSDISEAGSLTDSDTVTVYNSDGSSTFAQYFGGNWFDDSFADMNSTIIYPGEGFALSLGGSTEFTFVGTVSADPVVVPVSADAVNLIGSLNPIEVSGENAMSNVLSNLADSSTVTVYSEDGNLASSGVYTIFGGVWYDAGFNPVDLTLASPSSIVVSAQSSTDIVLPQAYNP